MISLPSSTLRAALAAVVLVPTLAACGGTAAGQGVASLGAGSGNASASSLTPTTTLSAADREATLMKGAQCMRDHGVTAFPDPTVDSNGNARLQGLQGLDRNDPATRTAFTACRQYFAAARPQFTPAQRQQLQDTLLKYAKCMRTNGYNMPDPTFGQPPAAGQSDGQRGGPFGDINRNDPAFQKAQPICQPLLAGAFPGGGRGFGFGGGGGGGGAPPTGSGGGGAAPAPTQ